MMVSVADLEPPAPRTVHADVKDATETVVLTYHEGVVSGPPGGIARLRFGRRPNGGQHGRPRLGTAGHAPEVAGAGRPPAPPFLPPRAPPPGRGRPPPPPPGHR